MTIKFLSRFKPFVDEILAENGRNYKLSILEKYKNDECVKYFLQQAFDPYIVFGISDKKLNKDVGFQLGTVWLDYPEDSEIFNYLSKHNTGTDIDIWTVQQYRKMHVAEEFKDLFDKIVTKKLILGISASTINKVFSKDTIREFNVMLANKFFDKPEVVEGKEFVITTKIDGMRCIMMKENDNVTFWSRQGQQIEGLVDLEEEARKYLPNDIALDGELVADVNSPDTYKDTMKRARTKDLEKHGLKMKVFDGMPLDDFKNQHCDLTYTERQLCLDNVFMGRAFNQKICSASQLLVADRLSLHFFERLPFLYVGNDTSMITKLLDEQTAKGEEGVMINICNAKYVFDRTSELLKVKKMQTLDLSVIGFEEGSGRNSGTLGALLVSYKGCTVKVGSGFSDELRDEIWKDTSKYLNRIIEVQYFEETNNQSGGLSLRFPVFKDFRDDKTEPDF